MSKVNFKFLAEQSGKNIAGVSIILCIAVIAPFYGGWDYLVAYRGETLSGQYVYTFNPLPAYWFFYPFAILPPFVGYLLWNLLNAFGFIYALHHWKADILAFAFTIVCFWNFFGGQFEGVLAAAVVFSLTANPWLAGLGLCILTFKPQVGLIVIIFVLVHRRNWRMLIIPGLVYLLSFLVYGWWIPSWFEHVRYGQDVIKIGQSTNISIFPFGFIFLPLILRYRHSLKIWILSASLAFPYYPIYSLAGFFTMESLPWWYSLGLWVFYLAQGIFPDFSWLIKFVGIIPLSLLFIQIWKMEKNKSILEHGE